jgi:two-component system sensor kinase FixL
MVPASLAAVDGPTSVCRKSAKLNPLSHQFDPRDAAVRVLAAIVESSDDAILSKDLNGTILTWNRGAERIYGYEAHEAVGRSVAFLVPPDQPDELGEINQQVARGDRVDHYETVRVTKDGRRIDVSLSVSPIRDEFGAIVGAATIARDITLQKRDVQKLTESEARLRSVVDAAVDAIIVIDERGLIEAFNPGAERMFGYRGEEVFGRNVNLLMPAPYRDEHDGYMGRYLATGVARIIGIGREVSAQRKDGSTFPVHLSVGEMSLQGQRKFTGILHDLTARVQVEAQLREQAALVRLGEMAAVIAHEVKNPLAAVRGAIQVIGKRLGAGSREADVIGDIIARIDTLNLLVKDLLLFARPPQPRPLPIDVSMILAGTAALLGEDAAHASVRVTLTGMAPPILADAELLKIVFTNLLINSAQAMKGQGDITVHVTADDGVCCVVVSDAGPGIPHEVRDKLFTPFVTTKSRGTGLGLSTVKRLVEAHHGQIIVDSPAAGGTVVTIRLPLAPPN